MKKDETHLRMMRARVLEVFYILDEALFKDQ